MSGSGRQATLAFDDEDPDAPGSGQLERQRLAGGEGHAVARWPGVRLEEERLAGHLGVARQAAPMAQAGQVLPRQREPPILGEGEARVARPLEPGSERLVEDGKRRVDQRHGVAGREHEAIAEAQPRPADVPAHRPGQEQRQEHVDLGSRAAGMPALAVVELQVDELVDQILEDLVVGEVAFGARQESIDFGLGRAIGRGRWAGRGAVGSNRGARNVPSGRRHRIAAPPVTAPCRASTSGSMTARVRLTASMRFSREFA